MLRAYFSSSLGTLRWIDETYGDPTARGAGILRTRPGAPLPALEEKPDERQ